MTVKTVQPRTERRALLTERQEQSRDAYGPWLSAESAAEFLDFRGKKPVEAFRVWAKRHGIFCAHRGSRLLYARVDLERAIGVGGRHGRQSAAGVTEVHSNSIVAGER